MSIRFPTGRIRRLLLAASLAISSLAVATLIAFGCGESEPSPETAAAQELERGIELFDGGHVHNARQAFDEAARLDPQYAEAYARRAAVWIALGDHARAASDIAHALELESDLPITHRHQGLLFIVLGDESNAILAFSRVIELQPDSADGYIDRARAYLAVNDAESALADMNSAAELKPEDARILLIRAWIHITLGDTGRAQTDLHQALSLTREEELITEARRLLSLIP